MSQARSKLAQILCFSVLALGLCVAANAAQIPPSYSTTAGGTTGPGTNYVLGPPGVNYGNTFTTDQSGALIGTGFGFYDDIIFTVSGVNASSVTSTIDLGNLVQISGLQVRLFNYAGNTTLPVFGSPAGGAIDAWSTPISSGPVSGTISVIPTTLLNPGTYVLEIRGTATGSLGGNYSGVLNLAPVPLPAGLPLLLSGLSALGFGLRRRTKA